jgi:RHS repeat-associated protein
LLESKDPLDRVVEGIWNARGEKEEDVDAMGRSAFHDYDAIGNRLYFTNRRGKTYGFTYDDANRLLTATTPTGKTTSRTYYGNNLLKTVTEPSTQLSSFFYNAKNLVSTKTDGVGTTTYAYDDSGNIETISEGSAALSNAWDERGRLKTFTNADGDVFGYKYDGNGNLLRLTYPGGKQVNYTYNARNQLETVTDWRAKTTTYLYDRLGRLTGVQRPNNTEVVVNRDDAGQVREIRDSHSGSLFNFIRLGYDAAGQITSAFRAPVYQGLQNPPPSSSASYDDDNRLTSFGGLPVGHDADGNMTSGPIAAGGGSQSLSYNARNQLTSVAGVSYTYDAQGTRRTLTDSLGTTRYSIDPNAELSRLLIKHNPDSTKTYYVYGIGLLYEVDEADNSKTHHYDQTGSTIARTDDLGNLIGTAQYSPYGLILQKSGDMNTPFLFNGEQGVMTDSNGLLFMRARYYSPYLMRFLNPDPAGFTGGTNWFSFSDGNPISKSDPFGLWGWRNTFSLALDFIPVVGTIKGAVELVAGYDFIAGEDVNRGIAAAGMVAGLIPGGKAAIKGGSKMFSTGLRHADEAAEIAESVVKNGDGFIYKRTSTQAEEYIGKSKDYDNFLERQYRHDLNPKLDGPHNFEVMGNAKPGLDLNILEETWMRNGGGLQREGGTLLNGRHEMNADRYLDGVNKRLWEYQQNMLWQNGLLNGAVQSINRIK